MIAVQGRGALRVPRCLDSVLVFAVALVARLGIAVAGPGGPAGNGYDQGVYYTAADALIHGRLPYRDFVLLHPPGIMLVLTPFAALGQMTTDHLGFVVANVAFATLGAANATLVFHVARNLGLDRRAALVGGLFYAVWLGAVGPETSTRLEPLGTFAFLCALLVLTRRPTTSRRNLLLAGGLLGFAVTVKIWWGLPLLLLGLWQLRGSGGWRRLIAMATGAAAAAVAVFGPFVVATPSTALRMVFADQFGRHATRESPVSRLEKLASIHGVFRYVGTFGSLVLLAVVGALAATLAAAAWRRRTFRPLIVLAAAQTVVLLLAPTYFSAYSGYPAAAFALVLAAGVSTIAERPEMHRVPRRAVAGSAVAATVLLAAGTIFVGTRGAAAPRYSPAFKAAAASVPCVVADSPLAQINLDVLSLDLSRGCPNWVDVSGRTHDTDTPRDGKYRPRSHNPRWQADAMHYLLSGNAVIVIRPDTGLSAASLRTIRSLPVLARSDRTTLHVVQP